MSVVFRWIACKFELSPGRSDHAFDWFALHRWYCRFGEQQRTLCTGSDQAELADT